MEHFHETVNAKHLSMFILSDIHTGNANHNREAFRKAVDNIKKTSADRSVFTVLLGDMADMINVKDPRFSPSEICAEYSIRDLKDLPRKQYQRFAEDVAPIRDTIKYALVGNHEESYIKHGGFDVYDYLCTDLLKCRKLGYFSLGRLTVKDSTRMHSTDIMLTHGSGGGGFREGNAKNNIHDISRSFDCDLYVMGHIHKLEASSELTMSLNQKGDAVKRKRWYGVAGCFLDTYTEGTRGYFEGRKGRLSRIGYLEYRIDKTTDDWTTELVAHELD